MDTTKNEPQFVGEVIRRKQAFLEHHRRLRWIQVASALGGVAAGLSVWYSQPASDRDGIHASFAFGVAGGFFFMGCLFGRMTFPVPSAQCPRCGWDWNREGEEDAVPWVTWRHCPGCGLKIGEE